MAPAMQIFKWEERKGHDVLLSAYLKEFSVSDNVELYLKTAPFHGSSNFLQQMHAWAEQHLSVDPRSFSSLPKVYVISSHLSQVQLRSLYKAADAFVLPSRCVQPCSRRMAEDLLAAVLPCGALSWLMNAKWGLACCRGEGWGRPHVEAMSMQLPGRHSCLSRSCVSACQ